LNEDADQIAQLLEAAPNTPINVQTGRERVGEAAPSLFESARSTIRVDLLSSLASQETLLRRLRRPQARLRGASWRSTRPVDWSRCAHGAGESRLTASGPLRHGKPLARSRRATRSRTRSAQPARWRPTNLQRPS